MMNLPPHLTPQSSMEGMQQGSSTNPMGGQMMEGMADRANEPEKILAHFAPDELESLDELQGGIFIDPETNLREYMRLDEIFRVPEIKDEITAALSQMKQSQGTQKFSMGGEVEPGRPIDPELEELRLQGRKGDTELVIITPYLLETFSEWAGKEPGINPTTGFPEFFSFNNLFKSVIRVGGALGGPITGFLASKLTGQSTSGALKNAGIGLSLAALPFVGPTIGSLGGMMGGVGGSGGLGGMLSSLPGVGQIFGGGGMGGLPGVGGATSSVAANTIGRILPGSSFGGGAGGGMFGGAAGGGGGGGGMLSGMGNMLPMIGSSLLMAKGSRDEQKGMREHQRQLEGQEARQRQESESLRDRMGFNRKLSETRPFDFKPKETNLSEEEIRRGVEPEHFGYNLSAQLRAGGGAIRGIGKGQEDNIPKNIKENSYIIDASTVSDIGDGSTDAGIKELDNYFSRFSSDNRNSNQIDYKSKGGYVSAMVSDGEYEISPEKVTALGHGSNEKGAQILNKFIKEVRSKKRTSGERLPPKAQPISGYLKRMQPRGA